MKKIIIIAILCLMFLPFINTKVVYADVDNSGSATTQEPQLPGEPGQPKDQFWDQPSPNELVVENDVDSISSPWLYVGIGVGVVTLAVGAVFVVKVIKRKKEQW